jgi:hypothetical protein
MKMKIRNAKKYTGNIKKTMKALGNLNLKYILHRILHRGKKRKEERWEKESRGSDLDP